MDAIERRLVAGLSVVAFLALYVASWYWSYPFMFDFEKLFGGHQVQKNKNEIGFTAKT